MSDRSSHIKVIASRQKGEKRIMDDLISRQAAIDELAKFVPYAICDVSTESYTNGLTDAYNLICQLPSAQPQDIARDIATIIENEKDMRVIAKNAQPEQLTDKEQRLFLAAMEREKKVCKQVDDECRNCREPYEDSLVRTCHEVIRKVKGALWT